MPKPQDCLRELAALTGNVKIWKRVVHAMGMVEEVTGRRDVLRKVLAANLFSSVFVSITITFCVQQERLDTVEKAASRSHRK